MTQFEQIMDQFGIPGQVVIAIIAVVFVTESTKEVFKKLEEYLEAKKGKEIKFFDHTKIVFLIFWSIVAAVLLAVNKVITWPGVPLYVFVIIGSSSVCYELILKKVKKCLEDA